MSLASEEAGLDAGRPAEQITDNEGRDESKDGSIHTSPEKTNHDTTEKGFKNDVIELQSLHKGPSNGSSLTVPTDPRPNRSRSPDTISLISADEFSELRQAFSYPDAGPAPDSRGEANDVHGWGGFLASIWIRNKGVLLVLLAQIFGSLMSVTTKLLEMSTEKEKALDPFQILFARMSITTVFSLLYMWWNQVEHWPLGPREVRALLVARGLGGFFGVIGLYWSMLYLPLADATVITFLAPILACWACSKLINDAFTRTDQIGGLVSLIGVILIARPASIFTSHGPSPSATAPAPPPPPEAPAPGATDASSNPEATPMQRLAAVGVALIGVLGAAVAYTTIRWIGQRAHALVSVNYFSTWCTLVSAAVLLLVPSVPFVLPSTLRQWTLLAFIGVSGFVMQFLLTAGLRHERGSRATNMVYSQMVFALAADYAIWRHTPGWTSLAGSALILGSAVVVAVRKDGGGGGEEERGKEGVAHGSDEEEAVGLVEWDRERERVPEVHSRSTGTDDSASPTE